jgi:ABC-2 type transport system permease protein
MAVFVVLVFFFSCIEAYAAQTDPHAGLSYATDISTFASASLGQFTMAILSVVYVCNEYSSREIYTTFLSAPRRWQTLCAKAIVMIFVSFVATCLVTYAALLCVWPASQPSALVDNRFTVEGLRTMAGTGLAVVLVALMAVGFSALIRQTVITIGIVSCFTLLIPWFTDGTPVRWLQTVTNYMIGISIDGLAVPPAEVDPAEGFFPFVKALWVSACWVVIPLIGGLIATRKCDV